MWSAQKELLADAERRSAVVMLWWKTPNPRSGVRNAEPAGERVMLTLPRSKAGTPRPPGTCSRAYHDEPESFDDAALTCGERCQARETAPCAVSWCRNANGRRGIRSAPFGAKSRRDRNHHGRERENGQQSFGMNMGKRGRVQQNQRKSHEVLLIEQSPLLPVRSATCVAEWISIVTPDLQPMAANSSSVN